MFVWSFMIILSKAQQGVIVGIQGIVFDVLFLATIKDIIVDIIPLLCRGSSVSYYAERRL